MNFVLTRVDFLESGLSTLLLTEVNSLVEGESSFPHSSQNLALSVFSVPQLEHFS